MEAACGAAAPDSECGACAGLARSSGGQNAGSEKGLLIGFIQTTSYEGNYAPITQT